MMRKKQIAGALALGLAMWGGAAKAITIEFDYSLDTSNYFTTTMRQELDVVGSIFGRNITDSFGPLTNFNLDFARFGAPSLNIQNLNLPADTLRVYIEPADLSGGTLGQAFLGTAKQNPSNPSFGRGFGGFIQFDTVGTEAFINNGALDYRSAPRNWYVDDNITTLETFPTERLFVNGGSTGSFYEIPTAGYDFYSVAMHEMGHVFGLDHLPDSDTSFAYGASQSVAMGPTIAPGERDYFTVADWTAMQAAGWQVASVSPALLAPVPEPESYAMLLAGLGLIGTVARRRAKPTLES